MFLMYLKLSIRVLWREKVQSFLALGGFGFACKDGLDDHMVLMERFSPTATAVLPGVFRKMNCVTAARNPVATLRYE